MTDTVLRVEAYEKNGKKHAFVFLTDGLGEKKAWCPDQAAAQALALGRPLPDGWEVSVGEYGPRAMPPKKGGGGGGQSAWRNTEVGSRFEDERWRWKVVYEAERSDRRTALMQAVAIGSGITTELAEKFYVWLRSTVPSSPAPLAGSETAASTGSRVSSGASVEQPPDRGVAAGSSPAPGTPKATVAGDDPSGPESVDGAQREVAVPTGPDMYALESGAAMGKGPPAPVQAPSCLHLKGVFEKWMANGDRLRFCNTCKQRLEVVQA